MRKLLVGGNWKQNGTVKFATDFSKNVLSKATFNADKVEVVVAPAAIHLLTAQQALGASKVQLSA